MALTCFTGVYSAVDLDVFDLSEDTISSIKETFSRRLGSQAFVDEFIGTKVESESVETGPILPVFSLQIMQFVLSKDNELNLEDYLSFKGFYLAIIQSGGKTLYLMDFRVIEGVFDYIGGMGAGEWTDAILEFEKKRQRSDTKHAFILNAFPVMKLVRITTDDKVEIYSMNPPGHESSNTLEGLKEYLKVFFPFSDDQ
jgi:hypothetical protein